MEEPRIIYSLDAFPLINNRWQMGNKLKETIYMTALSILYSHLWYKDIELYADETAYKFLYMLPCRITKVNHEQNKELWMKSKIHAIERQTKPFVHLDTDVFIKKKINFNFDTIILERRECGYEVHYKKQIDFFNPYTKNLPYWHSDLGHSYSCGVLGFNDLTLRNKFVSAYYDLEEIYIAHREEFEPLKQQGFEPCIVIEQYNLASLLDHNTISPTLLLKGKNIIEQSKYANEMSYSHLFGLKKYKKDIIEEIEYRLFKIFPYWYAQIKIELEKHQIIQKEENSSPTMLAS
ncbi:DUF6734 family protein [Flavobacterium collinsii]|uniref:DUF6734 domain-containing protein n=1 Tax=Flavobacterium collinsii TaxID=1114861 RepID=A0A9W4XE83_9FLAO|nr:DUF6734 family protein [Flavobacterium collinsii]CAI2766907.1 conserved protein of unknown function [Flavobacterium collinsii]